ncbi:secreted protein [Dokdonia sp. 4H-3-7-5]|nr:secreted protein [Dokdonia sp. 4H-3-7-5]
MHKLWLLCMLFLCSLCAKATAIQKTQEETTTEEIVEEKVIYPENTYHDPRGIVSYDEGTVIPLPISENSLDEYKQDDEFNYREATPEDTWWSRFKRKIDDLYNAFIRWLTGGNEATGVWAVIVELLPYLLIVGLLVFFVWLFMKIDSGSLLMEKIKAPETLLSDDEELIQRQDLDQLIEQAIAAGNYRLAVRFYYLRVLQKMSEHDLIDWQVQKTNHDYLFEIEDLNLRNQFRKVTDIYDYIWYGNFEVDETAFAKAKTSFTQINNQL